MIRANPPGFVPEFGQGLLAKPEQEGTEGGREWLKCQKLHKYWPMFSHWSYRDFMSLTEENIEDKIRGIRCTGMTAGAKGKLLRCIAALRSREESLLRIQKAISDNELHMSDAIHYILQVLQTPFPKDPGYTICETLITTIMEVYSYCKNRKCSKWILGKLDNIFNEVAMRPVLKNTMYTVYQQMLKKEFSAMPVEKAGRNKVERPPSFRKRTSTEDSGYDEMTTERINLPINEENVIFKENLDKLAKLAVASEPPAATSGNKSHYFGSRNPKYQNRYGTMEWCNKPPQVHMGAIPKLEMFPKRPQHYQYQQTIGSSPEVNLPPHIPGINELSRYGSATQQQCFSRFGNNYPYLNYVEQRHDWIDKSYLCNERKQNQNLVPMDSQFWLDNFFCSNNLFQGYEPQSVNLDHHQLSRIAVENRNAPLIHSQNENLCDFGIRNEFVYQKKNPQRRYIQPLNFHGAPLSYPNISSGRPHFLQAQYVNKVFPSVDNLQGQEPALNEICPTNSSSQLVTEMLESVLKNYPEN